MIVSDLGRLTPFDVCHAATFARILAVKLKKSSVGKIVILSPREGARVFPVAFMRPTGSDNERRQCIFHAAHAFYILSIRLADQPQNNSFMDGPRNQIPCSHPGISFVKRAQRSGRYFGRAAPIEPSPAGLVIIKTRAR